MDFNAKRCLFVIEEESEKEEDVDTAKLETSIGNLHIENKISFTADGVVSNIAVLMVFKVKPVIISICLHWLTIEKHNT